MLYLCEKRQDWRLVCMEAESEKPITAFLKTIPEMESEVVEAAQWFPPSPDLYGIIHALIS